MSLLEEYIAREVDNLRSKQVSVRILGDLERLAPGARQAVDRVMAETAGGEDLALNLCISYSSRAEITRAARQLAEEVAAGRLDPADIDEDALARRLYTAPWPDPDLLIRTSGRDADLELPALAAGLRRALRDARPLAGLHPTPPVRGHPGISAARSPVRPRLGLMDANLVRRVGFAVVAIPLALLLVWYGGLPLVLLLVAAAALATRELFDLAERQQIRPARVLGLVSAAAISPIAYAAIASPGPAPWSTRPGPMPRRSG